jgi:hypothetical protein
VNPSDLHVIAHPNVPFTASAWSEAQTLHVACAISNPVRWRTRRELMNNFRRHMAAAPNVVLHVGELAYGDRPFEVTDARHPRDYQFRTGHELWHKENLLNLVVQRFPAGWKYGCYVDGDFTFTRHDWALETVHALQHHPWVQMFSHYVDLGPAHEPVAQMQSFAQRYVSGDLTRAEAGAAYARPDLYYPAAARGRFGLKVRGVGATGAAWAFRREAFDACGGLLDTCAVGSGDWHMAFGLIGVPDEHPQVAEMTACTSAYARSIAAWQTRASAHCNRDIGVVNCLAVHHYHGDKSGRGYDWRWRILRDHQFDPYTDLFRDAQGVYQLTPAKPGLRDALRAYFRSRNEDR